MSPRLNLKSRVQSLLRQAGVYHRLRTSRIYDIYWLIADRTIVDDLHAEAAFYRRLLSGFRRGDIIFDIGANLGHKTNIFLRIGAQVVAVDPDPLNQQVLRESFLKLRFRRSRVIIVGKAVSDRDGMDTFWMDAPGSAKNTLSRKWVDTLRADEHRFGSRLDFTTRREVETVSLENLITEHGTPFFIKIDVEGHEPNVLRGLRRPIPYLSFEVNLPEFRPEGHECVDLLGRLEPRGRFNYTTDCRRGLALTDWVSPAEFRPIFAYCRAPSIEVFWHVPGLPSADLRPGNASLSIS